MKIGGVSILAVLNFHRIYFTPGLNGVRPNLATSVIRAGINGPTRRGWRQNRGRQGIWFPITFPVGLPWTWLKSRIVSPMTGTSISWAMFKYLRHNNKISLLEYLPIILSAITEKYFFSSTISLLFTPTNFAMQAMIPFWVFCWAHFCIFWSVFKVTFESIIYISKPF